MARPKASYRHHGVALLRASTDPGGLDLPRDLDLADPGESAGVLDWIGALWCRETVSDPIATASPALAAQINELTHGGSADPDHVRRAAFSLAFYLLRWTHRPTPFGLFAGTAFVRAASRPAVRWGGKDKIYARADAAWLAGIVGQLERQPALLESLAVTVHSAASIRGARCIAPGPPVDHADLAGAPVEISARMSAPVRAALEAAVAPLTYMTLREQIARQFPAAAAERIDTMLRGLIAAGFMTTALRAPGTVPDALGHVCEVLAAANADQIPESARTAQAVQGIHEVLADPAPGHARVGERIGGLDRGEAAPLMLDTVLDCEVTVPEQVLAEARDAADLLHRLSPHPVGYPAWRDYHGRFRARYGTGDLVPLLELVGDAGLGFPAGYLGSGYERAPRKLSVRDETILELVQRAQADDSAIELTGLVIADLEAAGEILYAPRAEICVEVRSATLDDLAHGRFQLSVTGTPRPGSSMAGRFTHLLDPGERDQIAATYAAHQDGAIAAQLSFAPRKRSNENLTRTPRLLPDVISIGEHRDPDPHVITPQDLAVGADPRRLYLVHTPTGRLIEPRVSHALEAGVQTPPLARFIAEVATARCSVYKAFDFGAAAQMPYLPQVRYRRTVLAPARWRLTVRDLPGPAVPMSAWDTAFTAWRARWRVPDHVALTEDDRRLPMDLTHPAHRLLLRTRLDAAGRLELREAVSPDQYGWIGRAHELLIPLTLTRPVALSAVALTARVTREPEQLPGASSVLHARLFAHPARYDEILTDHLPELTNSVPGLDCWWFRRHREMTRPEADQYLSVYLRLSDPGAYGAAASAVHAFASSLQHASLCSDLALTTYHPQAGRFGHGPALRAAEEAFAADTTAALAQIRAARNDRVHRQALAAASMVAICAVLADSPDHSAAWMLEQLPRTGPRIPAALREQTLALIDPADGAAALATLPDGEAIAAAWSARTSALRRYHAALAVQRDPLSIARSLLHLHHVRAVRVDPQTEQMTERLARAAALRWSNRQEA